MKTKLLYFSAVLMFMVGCEKKLELDPPAALNTQTALSNLDGIRTALIGAYSSLRSTNYYGRNYSVIGEVGADNVYVARANSNRFISSYQRIFSVTDGDVTGFWNTGYAAILRCNNVINNIDGVAGAAAEKNQIKGEALFLRALIHFDLVRMFGRPYVQNNGNNEGVPIITSFAIGSPRRNTVAEVYTQVIADLTQAKTLMSATVATTKFAATQFSAAALLSRVALYMGDNVRAASEADFVTNNAAYQLTPAASLAAYFNTPGAAEDIFTVNFLGNESLGADNLGAIYLLPGYGDIRVSPDLVNVFQSVDLRRTSFIGAFTGSPSEFQNNKFTITNGINLMTAPKVLRLAEVILNRAEANAKRGQSDATVLADLNRVRTARGLSSLLTVPAGTMLDSVLTERRRELMFEGHRFYDLTRNNRSIDRVFGNNTFTTGSGFLNLAANDNRILAPIPQRERDANPNMTQNPGY